MYRFLLYDRQQLEDVNGVNQIGQAFCQVSIPKTIFVDDCVCYPEIRESEDTVKLQEDI